MARSNFERPGEWAEWSEWLSLGLHGRNRWRLAVLFTGVLFAGGRRTVTSWLRAAGVDVGWGSYYYLLSSLGRKTNVVSERLFMLILRKLPLPEQVQLNLDDTPTKRYGRKVEGADFHRNPTPGPSDALYVFGHVWVAVSLVIRHPLWGPIGLPLRALLYVRQQTVEKLATTTDWKFATKFELGADLVEWFAKNAQRAGKRVVVVVDGFYAARPFLKRAIAADATVVGRLRKDAKIFSMPPLPRAGQPAKGRRRTYGKDRFSLQKRAAHPLGWQEIECTLYQKTEVKQYKSFIATYRPAGGAIRVVIVREKRTNHFLYSTDSNASPQAIIEAFADRANIEQVFHDEKEIWGAGEQQLRNIWANIGALHINLWAHTMMELWAWHRPKQEICDRTASPWDDANRRPSHADRRKALRRKILEQQFLTISAQWHLPRKMYRFTRTLLKLAA